MASCAGTKPDSIGQFSECPEKPNCIFSKSSTALHMIAPLIYQSTFPEAKEKLLKVIKSMPRAEIATNKENFLHVEFTSNIFRFVDDVEFYFNEPGIIHFRSASRIGHSDMGVNRHRMEEIRHLFTNDFFNK
jgi:uncharacterized protein (DUF1499 family)